MGRRSSMKLKIENFAKIKEADIEINGITIIAGENNTGKSTIGKILYCIYQSFHDLKGQVAYERMKVLASNLSRNDDISNKYNLFSEPKKFKGFITKLYNSGIDNLASFLNEENISVSEKVYQKLLDAFLYSNDSLEKLIVTDIFNSEFNEQVLPIGKKGESSHVSLSIMNRSLNKIENINLFFDKNTVIIKEKIDLYKEAIYIDNPFILDEAVRSNDDIFNDHIEVINMLGMGTTEKGHNYILQKKLSKSLKNIQIPLIEKGILEERLKKALEMIHNTLQGDIVENNNKFTFHDNGLNDEIELSNLSTGIKSFAILLKLINNFDIIDNSLIVLDEPEVHLHPKWQLKFAEILVLLQKEFNLNIVITSHSPYFINAIEVFSNIYNIEEKCKFYLSGLDKDNRAIFEDVSQSCGKIYDKLAEPFDELEELIFRE